MTDGEIGSEMESERPVEDAGHVPVLLAEVIERLAPRPGEIFLDGTLGMGGHAREILARLGPTGRLVGVDRDEEALERARGRLEKIGAPFHLFRGVFTRLSEAMSAAGLDPDRGLDGILLDLGVSSFQLDTPRRGFSFSSPGPLDMRMSPEGPQTAARYLAKVSFEELKRVLKEYGEEPRATAIARAIVERRGASPLVTTRDLAELVEGIVPRAGKKTHPATRTFQAIRIALNRELELLEEFLSQVDRHLAPGGRLVILSYHSLEDRRVKTWFRRRVQEGIFLRVDPEWVRPRPEEVKRNPRARSARLRWAVRRGGSVGETRSEEK